MLRPPPTELPLPPPSRDVASKEVPDFQYLASRLQAHNNHRLLIILDIHGVLLERARKRDPAYKAALSHRPAWRNLSGYSIWLRPHLSCFLSILTTRFRVAAWSSATHKTITPLMSALSSSIQLPKPLDQSLEFLWMRDQCRKDTTRPYGSLKYLPDVWNAGFATENDTLILDDSPSKVRYTPSSALTVSEYSAQKLGTAYNNDDSLLWILLYIQYLADMMERCDSVVSARNSAIGFERFVFAGKAQARAVPNARRRMRLKSLAMVFLNPETHLDGQLCTVVGMERMPLRCEALEEVSDVVANIEAPTEETADTGKILSV